MVRLDSGGGKTVCAPHHDTHTHKHANDAAYQMEAKQQTTCKDSLPDGGYKHSLPEGG